MQKQNVLENKTGIIYVDHECHLEFVGRVKENICTINILCTFIYTFFIAIFMRVFFSGLVGVHKKKGLIDTLNK